MKWRTYLPWVGPRQAVILRPVQIVGGRRWSLVLALNIERPAACQLSPREVS